MRSLPDSFQNNAFGVFTYISIIIWCKLQSVERKINNCNCEEEKTVTIRVGWHILGAFVSLATSECIDIGRTSDRGPVLPSSPQSSQDSATTLCILTVALDSFWQAVGISSKRQQVRDAFLSPCRLPSRIPTAAWWASRLPVVGRRLVLCLKLCCP